MKLSDEFHYLLSGHEDDTETQHKVAELVFHAAASAERDGLLALMYHEGIGVPINLDKCFELAENASRGGDALGYFLLGYMCDNAETPDQAEGGPRQKYDHYDAERFYEHCAHLDSRWKIPARLWLGDYYMDMAQGGDPEIVVEHYEAIAESNDEAAGKLSDYYWNLIMPEYFEDEEWRAQLYKWTVVAVRLNPEEYSFRMGWIYADGIGCKKDPDKAINFFNNAYNYGDWRGAGSIAKILEESIEENPNMTTEDRTEREQQIAYWNKRADQMHNIS